MFFLLALSTVVAAANDTVFTKKPKAAISPSNDNRRATISLGTPDSSADHKAALAPLVWSSILGIPLRDGHEILYTHTHTIYMYIYTYMCVL